MLLRVRLCSGRWVAQVLYSISLGLELTESDLPGVPLNHNVTSRVMIATARPAKPKHSAIISLVETDCC
jgi:hypothetical protein